MAGTIEGEVRQMKKRIPIGLKSYDMKTGCGDVNAVACIKPSL